MTLEYPTPLRTAALSDCGRYRYHLTRRWLPEPAPSMCWIMLNPSTADASIDDPTIRRCIGFARAWGYGAIEVLNLFAFRSVDPRALARVTDPVGPENDGWLVERCTAPGLVVVAWGANELATERARRVLEILDRSVRCLGTTKSGAPRHPLYAPGSIDRTDLEVWKP